MRAAGGPNPDNSASDVGQRVPSILLATQPHQDSRRVATAVNALLRIERAQVILRPHPSEPAEKYASCVELDPARVSCGTGVTIDELLGVADLVVTEFSTVALEGAILGIPVVIATFLGDRSDPRMFDGLSVVAHTVDDLHDTTRGLLSREARPADRMVDANRLHALVGPLDGRSGIRVARLVHSLRDAVPRGDQALLATRVRAFTS